MESLPSLQNFHLALTHDGSAVDAEEELLSVVSHLLVCAIEDPGIPNPVRHTTLLGQSLRNADITNGNISEILRIYLYAVATGEVRTLNGITLDRDRERRVADHHCTDADQPTYASTGKNSLYYELLHENITWKLAECLKQNPFVSLNPTVKTQILAHLCNDLLLNKAVIKQIEGSLEAMAQYKREKYLLDNRIRKYKHLHMRKIRMEQFERSQMLAKQQAEALANAQTSTATTNPDSSMSENNNLSGEKTATTEQSASAAPNAEESTTTSVLPKTVSNLTNASSMTDVSEIANNKEDSVHSADVVLVSCTGLGTNKLGTDNADSPPKSSTDLANRSSDDFPADSSLAAPNSARSISNGTTTPDLNSLLNKKIISRTSEGVDISTNDVTLDDDLSDLESEGTMLEEDEDNRMTADEIQRKLEKILKSSAHNKMMLEQSCNALRATCYGQDRFWRRYWHLPKTGGIFVEALESAQPDVLKYHGIDDDLESLHTSDEECDEMEPDRRSLKRKHSDGEEDVDEAEKENVEETTPSVAAVASERNWADSQTASEVSVEAPAKAVDDGMMDIEDSIPTAILVQKANQNDEKTVEVNNHIGGVNSAKAPEADEAKPASLEASVDSIAIKPEVDDKSEPIGTIKDEAKPKVDDIEMKDESVDIKPKLENGDVKPDVSKLDDVQIVDDPNQPICLDDSQDTKIEPKDEPPVKIEIKEEDNDIEIITIPDDPKTEPIFDKWFSIANRELPLTSLECDTPDMSQIAYSNVTCEGVLQSQGNRWDIGNNAHYFNVPVENAMPALTFNRDSFLTVSGLDDAMMKREIGLAEQRKLNGEAESGSTTTNPLIEPCDDDKKSDTLKTDDGSAQMQAFHLPSFINMSLGNISAYIQCDNPAPLQMTPDEHRMLEDVKKSGLPKRLKRNLVPKNLRYGWWKVDDLSKLNDVIQCLHPRGVRERDLRQSLLTALGETIDLTTHCHVGNPQDAPPPRGYFEPEPMHGWSPEIARRVELTLLDQLETLEDKIASASMQIKGWVVPSKDDNGDNAMDVVDNISMTRDRILGLEAAIERRYLKPPLGTRYVLLYILASSP